MPHVTVFAKAVRAEGDSIRLDDSDEPVYEHTDLLFVTDTAADCFQALNVLRQLQAATIAVIEYVEAQRTTLIVESLKPKDNTDWCDHCEAQRIYDGEVCTSCGRVWGYDHPGDDVGTGGEVTPNPYRVQA